MKKIDLTKSHGTIYGNGKYRYIQAGAYFDVNGDEVLTLVEKSPLDELGSAVSEWLMVEASWWQFWLPRSGPVGGFICGTVFGTVSFMVFYLLSWCLR